MAGHVNKNLEGLPMYHLRRIGKPASKDGTVNVMDFYRITYIIGRSAVQVDFYIDSSNHIQSMSLSRCHARVVRQSGNQHRLYDDSLNGVFVNNIKIAGSCVLREGDKVTFGHPCGARFPAGSRSRQPDSDHQFMFEICGCERSDIDGTADTSKETSGFKKPISPAETSGTKSLRKPKRGARQTTQCFSHDDVRQLKKAWEDRQSGSSASETSDGEDTSGVDNSKIDTETEKDTKRTPVAQVQSFEAGLRDVETSNVELENVRNDINNAEENESGDEDSRHSDEVSEEAVENIANCNISHSTSVNEKRNKTDDQGGIIENESNEEEICLISDDKERPKNGNCTVAEREDLTALEGTFNSIIKDLCALRGNVEKGVDSDNVQQIPVMPTKSPTKDASIQTSQCEAGVDIESREQVNVSPTKEMGIQTSQTMFCEQMNIGNEENESAVEMPTHSSEITTPDLPETVSEMEGDSSVKNDLQSKTVCVTVNKELSNELNEETQSAKSSDESVSACIEMSEERYESADVSTVENSVETQLDSLGGSEDCEETFGTCIESAKKDRGLDRTDIEKDGPKSVLADNEVSEKQNQGVLVENFTTGVEVASVHILSTEETALKHKEFSSPEDESDEMECLLIQHKENESIDLELNGNENEDTEKIDNSEIMCTARQKLILSDSVEYDDDDEESEEPGIVLSNSIEFSDDDSESNISESETNEKQSDLDVEKEISDDDSDMDTELSSSNQNSGDTCSKPDLGEETCHEEIECKSTCNNGEQHDFANTERDSTEIRMAFEEKSNESETYDETENGQENCFQQSDNKKRKISNEFIAGTVTDISRKRHCSDSMNVIYDGKNKLEQTKDNFNVENILSCEKEAKGMIAHGDDNVRNEGTEERTSEIVQQSDEEDEKGLSSSQKGFQKLKKGVKKFFNFWSKKSYKMNDKLASDGGHIYLQDTSGGYKLLELECPYQISENIESPSVAEHTACHGSDQLQNERNITGMDVDAMSVFAGQDQHEFVDNAFKDKTEENEEEITVIECRETVDEKFCNENEEVNDLAIEKEQNGEWNEPKNTSVKESATTLGNTIEKIKDSLEYENSALEVQKPISEADVVETSMCQTDNEIDSDDMIKSSVLKSAFRTPSKLQLNHFTDETSPVISAYKQDINVSQSQSPVIAKQGIKNTDKSTVKKVNNSVIQLFGKNTVNDEVPSRLNCSFSDDDEDGFDSPKIDFSHLDDDDDDRDEIVEDSESDLESNQNDRDMFENDASGEENNSGCEKESDTEEDTANSKTNKSQIAAAKEDDKSVVDDKVDTGIMNDDTSDPLENFINHETESDDENTCNESDKEASDVNDLDFDFCDSETEKETSEFSKRTHNEVVIIAEDIGDIEENKQAGKRKSDSNLDDRSTKKKKDQNEIDELPNTSTPLKDTITTVTPFKTPSSVRRAKLRLTPGSSKRSPDHMSSTQLMDSSQTLDLDCLTATQASRVTEQLEVKASDGARSKASRNKAKDLLEKLRAKRRIKEEAVEDLPSSSPTQSTSGSAEVIYSRTGNSEESQALAVLEDVDKHVNSCRTVVYKMKSMFDGSVSLRGNPRVEAWRRELTDIEKRFEFPKTVIAVVGDTGAGKSSLMNAILDHRSVLPTSGIRACTAVVVEVVNNTTSTYFEADIEFLQRKEWMEELQVLLKDLTGLDGTVKNRQPDPTSDAFVSYCKVRAVYGRIDRFEVLARLTTITHWLGRVKVIKSTRPEDFRRQVEKYIETQDPGAGGQYWPIVKHVRLRMPNCDVCSSGAALVDLPGVRDSNAARDRIAKEYLKNCTAVWVVSSIHRAIDDKTAKDLLGENFRRQLLMDGQYGSIAFICTKTDVIIPSEIIRPLELEEKTKEHEDLITEMESEKSGFDLTVSSATAELRKLRKKVTSLKKEAQELHDSLDELKNLLDPTDMDSSQSEEKEAVQEYERELKEKEEELAEAENRIDELHDEKHVATQKTLELEKKLNVHRKTIAAICARARNEYARTGIRRDFKAGLKEMKRRAGMLNDDNDDEEEDIYSDDDDDDDVGSSTENLKVFCCSSTEYQKMKNLLTDDGPPQVFTSLDDTQIPALRHYVHEMTSIRRKQWLERLIRSVGRFVLDLQMYVCEGGDMKSRDRTFARSTIDSELQSFDSALAPVLRQLSSDIDGVFDGSIRQKMEEGAANAASEANDTCAKWSAPFNRDKAKDKRSGGLHWQTYKATVRRQGVYTSKSYGPVDFNEDLSEPMYRSMTIVWDRAFSGMLWKVLEKLRSEILNKLKTFISDLAPRLQQLGIQLIKTMRVSSLLQNSAANKLTEMVAHLKDMITNKQRDISRIITPHVQSSLLPEYNHCSEESGTGMYARIKSCMSKGIDTKRFTMFDDATQQLMQHLIDLQAEILQYVRQVCQSLIQDLRTAFEPLWESPSNTSVIRSAFRHPIIEACASVQQIYDEAGLPQNEERALVAVASNATVVPSTATGAAHTGGSNSIMAGGTDGSEWKTFENTFQRKQDTQYGSMEQCGQVGVRVKTERLSQTSVSETVEAVSRVKTLHVKQERTGGSYGERQHPTAVDQSLMNFGCQTLQDLQSGKLEVSPVEVTVQTTPVSTLTAPKNQVVVMSSTGQSGSYRYSHPGRIITQFNGGQSHAQNLQYLSQPVSIKQPTVTVQTSAPHYGRMNSTPGQNISQPVYGKSLVTGLLKNMKVPVTCTYVPSTSACVSNTMPGPNILLHSGNQTGGTMFIQNSNLQQAASVGANCPQVTPSSSSQYRTPAFKLVVGKENVSSKCAAGRSPGLITASQPCVNSSSQGKGKKKLGGRVNLSMSQKDSAGASTPPPTVIKTEPADKGVYGRVKYLGTIDLTDD